MYLIEGDFCKQKKKKYRNICFVIMMIFLLDAGMSLLIFFLMKAEVRMLLYLVIILFLIIC